MSSDAEDGGQHWVRSIYESRTRAKTSLLEAAALRDNPHECMVHPSDRSQSAIAHRRANAAVMDFYNDVRPYRQKCPKLWKEELYTARRPKLQQEVTCGINIHGELEVGAHDFEEGDVAVLLDNIEDAWRYKRVLCTYRSDEPGASQTRTEVRRVLLPVAAIEKVYNQLNDCLEKLNLAAKVDDIFAEDWPTEVPDHIKEEAPAFQQDGD